MKSPIPGPIFKTIVKVILCGIVMLLVGSVVAHEYHDDTLLILSCVVLALGSIKAEDLWQQALKGAYIILEGEILEIRQVNLQSKYRVTIQRDEQVEDTVLLAGKHAIKEMHSYRFYLSKPIVEESDWPLPEYLRPAQRVLGFEEIEGENDIN